MKNYTLILFCLFIALTNTNAQSWSKLGSGTLNGKGEHLNALCADPSGNIYTSGWVTDTNFNVIVAKWNGSTWSDLGAVGSTFNIQWQVNVLVSDASGNIYAAGRFRNDPAREFVVKWNGLAWSVLDSVGMDAHGDIGSMCVDAAGNLYVSIGAAGSPGKVTKWDGSTWTTVGALNANNFIDIVHVDAAGNVYAAGAFTDSTSGVGGNMYVEKWSGTSWSHLGTRLCYEPWGSNAQIFAVTTDAAGTVYAAGRIPDDTGGYTNQNVFKWTGSNWVTLGTGTNALNGNGAIFLLRWDASGNLYAAGEFTDSLTASGGYRFVAKWDGTSWTKVGGSSLRANDAILAMCFDHSNNLYVAGAFMDTTVSINFGGNPNFNPHYVVRYGYPLAITPVYTIAELKVYPNPASDILTVATNGTNRHLKDMKYSIYSIEGKQVISGIFDQEVNNISLEHLPSGGYLLRIEDETTTVYSIVKE